MKNNKEVYVEIYNGTSKKTGKEFECLRVVVGDWSTLVFPNSNFEMNYIKDYLNE